MVTLSEETEPSQVHLAFGHHLKRLRLGAGLTQESLAERAGVSSRLISNIERGTIHRPRRSTVEGLADALDLTDEARSRFLSLAFTDRFHIVEVPDGGLTLSHQVPVPGTSLVGRTAEVAAIVSCLSDPEVRVVTLTGPGGVGKTRLAIEVAHELAARFSNGVVLVDLTHVRDVRSAFAEIAHALSIRSQPGTSDLEAIGHALQRKQLLLVLDNTEQITEGLEDFATLISLTSTLKMLVTSRLTLNIRGERVFRIDPLPLPELGEAWSLDDVAANPAVKLFVDRARAVREGLRLDDQNAADIAEIVRAIDGLPLAIELAAARMSVLMPADLLELMDRRLALLTRGASDLPPRLRTLRSAIAWSYELQEESGRELLQNLAVFYGGFSLDEAEALHSDPLVVPPSDENDSPIDVVDGVLALVDANLVQALQGPDRATRFRMLETIHEFAAEQLAASGRTDLVAGAHARYIVQFAEMAAQELTGSSQRDWLRNMELERENVRAALAWMLRNDEGEGAVRLATAYAYFWQIRGHLAEGVQWLERSLHQADDAPAQVRARALVWLGILRYHMGQPGQESTVEVSIELFESARDLNGRAFALRHLGNIERGSGNLAKAEFLQEEALATFRALDNRPQICATLRNLGLGAYDQGEYAKAQTLLEEALTLGENVDERMNLGAIYNNYALVALALGDLPRAADLQARALDIWADVEYLDGIASSLENVALIGAAGGMREYAVRMFGAADSLKRRIGTTGRPVDEASNEAVMVQLNAALGDDHYHRLKEEGRTLSRSEALAMIRELPAAIRRLPA